MISRDELYRLVWSKPMTQVAEQFAVSGTYMARVCALLNVPRPERGYWAKLAVGKVPAPEPLPEARRSAVLVQGWSSAGSAQAAAAAGPPIGGPGPRLQDPQPRSAAGGQRAFRRQPACGRPRLSQTLQTAPG